MVEAAAVEQPSEPQTATETPEEQDERLQARRIELEKHIEETVMPFTQSDDYRAEMASSHGGFELYDQELLGRHRSVISEMLGQMGRKIMNGEFDLTRVSFPIRCMSYETALVVITKNFSTIPFFYNRASKCTDPIERMKMIIASEVSSVIYNKSFEKPLNPILGETFEGRGQDGSHIYLEQISHHPPISNFQIEHPNYQLEGSMEWAIRAGLQSADVEYLGGRRVTFPDGGKISFTVSKDKIYGLLMGTFGHQRVDKQQFKDEANGLTAFVEYGAYMFKKQDYIWGEIKKDGKKVCEITGNYCGFLNFDNVRYWDYREKDKIHFPIEATEGCLESDARRRSDSCYLLTKPVDEAQAEKERLENIQRNDRKLREAAAKRRANGGPKHVLPSTAQAATE